MMRKRSKADHDAGNTAAAAAILAHPQRHNELALQWARLVMARSQVERKHASRR